MKDGTGLALGVAGALAICAAAGPGKALGSRNDLLRLRRGVLTVGDRQIRVRPMGKGAFTRAYVTTGGRPEVYLLVDQGGLSGGWGKEILRRITEEAPSRYLPRTTFVGHTVDRAVYRMPLYRSPLRKADSAEAWDQFRAIRGCYDKATERLMRRPHQERIWSGHEQMDEVVDCARKARLPRGLVRALGLLRSYAADYGQDYAFEFSPRNLATTKAGRLILLDTVFSLEAVEMRRQAARLAARRREAGRG